MISGKVKKKQTECTDEEAATAKVGVDILVGSLHIA